MCVYEDTSAINSMNPLAAARQAPAARRSRESQCDLFLSSLRGYFYQCGWARLVLDRKGVPYSTGLQMKCVYTATDFSALIRHLHVCVCMCLAACLLCVVGFFSSWGNNGLQDLFLYVFPIKSQNSKLQDSADEEWKSPLSFVTLQRYQFVVWDI